MAIKPEIVASIREIRVYNRHMLRSLWISLRELLLPSHCAACGSPAPRDDRFALCEACGRALAGLVEVLYCPRCGRGAGPYSFDLDGCGMCRRKSVPYDGVARIGPYAEPLRDLVLTYKYGRRRELGPVLGRLLAERVALAPWADRVDMVVPVPLHWRRRVGRGFNQAAGLAGEVVRATRRRLVSRPLLRVRSTVHQTRLPPSRRAENVRGAFAVRGRAATLAGRRILLVDDVLTSGATMGECARTLKRAGAASVYAAVVAVAGPHEPGPW